MSPKHPTADGRVFEDLVACGLLDGRRIASVEKVPYEHSFTYDILPASDSGTYFASGVLVGSTLAGLAGKHVTAAGRDPATFADGVAIHDVPWAVELSNGQLILGAYWHDRFGIEHGPGNIELSPADAAWLFKWMEPEIPSGWHAVTEKATSPGVPIVNVRK